MGWPGGARLPFHYVAAITYTVNFQRFVQVTSHVFPSGSGTVVVTPSSVDAFYATGTALQFMATANPDTSSRASTISRLARTRSRSRRRIRRWTSRRSSTRRPRIPCPRAWEQPGRKPSTAS